MRSLCIVRLVLCVDAARGVSSADGSDFCGVGPFSPSGRASATHTSTNEHGVCMKRQHSDRACAQRAHTANDTGSELVELAVSSNRTTVSSNSEQQLTLFCLHGCATSLRRTLVPRSRYSSRGSSYSAFVMPHAEYEHVVDPYTSHADSLTQFASTLQRMKGHAAPTTENIAIASPNILAYQDGLVDVAATPPAVLPSSSTPAPDFTFAYAFFSFLLIILVLQAIVWVAQKMYVSSMQTRRFDKGGGGGESSVDGCMDRVVRVGRSILLTSACCVLFALLLQSSITSLSSPPPLPPSLDSPSCSGFYSV
jgi:hypothetical protein